MKYPNRCYRPKISPTLNGLFDDTPPDIGFPRLVLMEAGARVAAVGARIADLPEEEAALLAPLNASNSALVELPPVTLSRIVVPIKPASFANLFTVSPLLIGYFVYIVIHFEK